MTYDKVFVADIQAVVCHTEILFFDYVGKRQLSIEVFPPGLIRFGRRAVPVMVPPGAVKTLWPCLTRHPSNSLASGEERFQYCQSCVAEQQW